MKKQTKSAKIIDLLAKTDLTREQIAARVGCLPAYVRVVEQRLGAEPGQAPQDRWRQRNRETYLARMRERFAERYANDPKFRARQQKSVREAARKRRRDPARRQKVLEYEREYRRRKRAESRA